MLQITNDPIGRGKERACYVHPDDPRKAIKISIGGVSTQSRREIKFYRGLKKRGGVDEKHIPKFYGLCETNLGQGIVVDLIRNYDGEVSRPLNWYLAQGCLIEEFEPYLDELKHSFLQNLIIFNHDMTIGNLLVQKVSTRETRLVAIDGLGDVTALNWPDFFPFLVQRKIRRRWARFMARVYRTREVRLQREAMDAESAPGNQS
ncbi:MAG: PhoP regulatory network YrbL family protein [Gammaproteobacteria bacterium]|nr:PhoP regulatory network YrbL family protein [Gammaproteobacteria bacterium]